MAVDVKPLFRPEAVRPKLAAFHDPARLAAARGKLAAWAKLLATKSGANKKETELLGDFLRDVFVDALGYRPPPAEPYTLKRESLIAVDGKFADAALGHFGPADRFAVMLEGKGPKDPIDRPFAGRKRSAVEQALQYAVQQRTDWYLVTNLNETRLYHKGNNTFTYEAFETAKLAKNDAELARFVFLLGADRVLAVDGNHLDKLLTESTKIGRELTNEFYREYRGLRERTFDALRTHNPDRPPAQLLTATQKVLDRVLFVAFCEDRGLLPREIVARAYQHADPFNPRPVWQNFVSLFRAVDRGSDALNIWKYNGGLFATDAFLDSLTVPNAVCEGFKKLADYEYGTAADADAKLIDVEILGHIFEQSITDLEELHKAIDAADQRPVTQGEPSKRKREGAFYTPEFVTRYIVQETLGPVVRDRFEAYRRAAEEAAGRTLKKLFADPTAFDPAAVTKPQQAALAKFWEGWISELETVRVVDPSCGSGAFLIEAYDQMFAEYAKAQGYVTALKGSSLFDIKRTILTHNIFGMDLNTEAVEIARLSSWIKTAEYGKVLTSLDGNVVQGNSVVADPDPLTHWRARFPAAFAAGGFDAVIGNPPYVRQEWIKADKPYLERHYASYDGVADLYVYFYELGLKVLKPGGRLGFIVTNKWMKAGYGENLRKHFGESAWVEQVVDFGHTKQIFPDADVFPCILVAQRPTEAAPPAESRVCVIPRDLLRIDDLSRQIQEQGVSVPHARFGPQPWNLEPPGVAALMAKIKAAGVPLREFAKVDPLRGVVTGFNEAFLIDTATKEKLVTADPSSEEILRPYLRGQDIDRWQAEWVGLWMIFARRGIQIDRYPAVKQHLSAFRNQLEPKPPEHSGTSWGGRKPGSYRWYELQDPFDEWREFEKPKIVYQDIVWRSSFCLDRGGRLGNNTIYILPSEDLWLLSVLNSPASWWYAWRTAQHGKDEALRFFKDYIVEFPIPTPTDAARAEVESLVAKLIDLKAGRTAGVRAVLDWLRAEFGIDKPTQKLAALVGLSADDLIAEVKKAGGRKSTLSVAQVKRLKDEHAAAVGPLQADGREADRLERRVSDRVNAAFGLTPADVDLLWQTAPPRMPVGR